MRYFPSSIPVDIGHHFYDQPDLFSGNVSYVYDFKLPHGTAGMEPDLKLVYRSDNENGWFGMGWALEGLAYIESRRVYPYGYILWLNGSSYELVLASNTSSGKGEYHTKRESWLKINYNGSSWTVKTKNGVTYRMGATVAGVGSSRVRKWMVDQETDSCGNSITYSYSSTSSDGERYPLSITYTKNNTVNLSKVKTINFSLETRSDNVMPEACWRTYRISEMQVLIDGDRVDKYTFSYSTSNSSYRSLLTAINRYGKGNTPETTKMNYASQSGSLSWSQASYKIPVKPASTKNPRFGDVNGDGLTDIVEFKYDDSKSSYIVSYIWFNNGNSFTIRDYTSGFGTPVQLNSSVYPQLTDVNGDGFTDIITKRGIDPPFINTGNAVWYSNNSWKEPLPILASRDDLNNDGVLDGFSGNRTYLSSPSGAGWADCASYTGVGMYKAIADFDGDGYPDLLCENSTYLNNRNGGWTSSSIWAPPTKIYSSANCRDFDGDGLIDISNGSTSTIYMNNTNGWTVRSQWEFDSASGQQIDINGDNLFDIVASNGDSVYLRKPNGSFVKVNGVPGTGRFLYINDDPFPDVMDYNTGEVFTSNAQPDLLTKVTEPQGGTIAWTYKRAPIHSYLSNGTRSIPVINKNEL